ncbi:MAG: cysteine desulfurase NifS [Chloroflexi bacterium RBG_16_47_49]|nr:MAG: cysteine desulfurase NifS [Chloroflexi bacterium RBG_16_47_49]
MIHKKQIYFDYAATTPVDPRVMQVMLPYYSQAFGNPSSYHKLGQDADAALENAREMIARYMHCQPSEVIFTSCGTESDNLALRGSAFLARKERGANHILISPVEHHAISRTAQQLANVFGFELEYLPVDRFGKVRIEDVAARIRPDTAIVSVIYANNEIGTVNPMSGIGELCQSKGVIFHTDAVQAAGYLPLDVSSLHTDLISIGAHKFYGPKGIGALYIRQGLSVLPAQTGGGQEFGFRAGTQNVPYIVGMAEALHLAQSEKEDRIQSIKPLRDHLIGTILEEIPDVQLTGHPEERLPNHASFVFHGVDGNALLMMLDVEGFACSSGSACRTGNPEPSEVLTSLDLNRDWALGSLRVTLGIMSTSSEIEEFLTVLPKVISKLRKLR